MHYLFSRTRTDWYFHRRTVGQTDIASQ